jgi:hypothetical protein
VGGNVIVPEHGPEIWGGILLNHKGLVRLITLGLIVGAFVIGGTEFWIGLGLALLVVVGVAGGTRRTAAGWSGSLALLMGALVHLGIIQALVGSALAGIGAMGFLLAWTQGPARPRRTPAPMAPFLLRRRAG